jgi:hypothetical protein
VGVRIPHAVAIQWSNLLTQRALLYEMLRRLAGRDDYIRKSTSLDLEDRKAAAALERFTEDVINVFIDLSKDLLARLNEDHADSVRELPAEAVLRQLEADNVLDPKLRAELDEVREGRNRLLQHESSFAPAAAVWLTVEQTNGVIDRAIASLQSGFARAGYELDVELPDIT